MDQEAHTREDADRNSLTSLTRLTGSQRSTGGPRRFLMGPGIFAMTEAPSPDPKGLQKKRDTHTDSGASRYRFWSSTATDSGPPHLRSTCMANAIGEAPSKSLRLRQHLQGNLQRHPATPATFQGARAAVPGLSLGTRALCDASRVTSRTRHAHSSRVTPRKGFREDFRKAFAQAFKSE